MCDEPTSPYLQIVELRRERDEALERAYDAEADRAQRMVECDLEVDRLRALLREVVAHIDEEASPDPSYVTLRDRLAAALEGREPSRPKTLVEVFAEEEAREHAYATTLITLEDDMAHKGQIGEQKGGSMKGRPTDMKTVKTTCK